MNWPIIVGIVGTTILVVTFILNEHHKLSVDDFIFDSLHLVASICLMIYALNVEIYIFVFLSSLAALVSLKEVIQGLRDKPRSKIKVGLIRHKRKN